MIHPRRTTVQDAAELHALSPDAIYMYIDSTAKHNQSWARDQMVIIHILAASSPESARILLK